MGFVLSYACVRPPLTTLRLRKELNAVPDVKISVNDILIKAVATAVRHNPIVNCEWRDDVIRKSVCNSTVGVDNNTLFTAIVQIIFTGYSVNHS